MLQTYVGPTSIIALLSTGCHSPSKTPPLVIASYNINSQLLALGNTFSLGSSLTLCLLFQQSQQLPPLYQVPMSRFTPIRTLTHLISLVKPRSFSLIDTRKITIIIFARRVAATYHAILLVLHRYVQNGFKSVADLRQVKRDHVPELIHN